MTAVEDAASAERTAAAFALAIRATRDEDIAAKLATIGARQESWSQEWTRFLVNADRQDTERRRDEVERKRALDEIQSSVHKLQREVEDLKADKDKQWAILEPLGAASNNANAVRHWLLSWKGVFIGSAAIAAAASGILAGVVTVVNLFTA